MLNKNNHPYHMVDMSPWPLIISFSALSLFSSIINYLYFNKLTLLLSTLILIFLISFLWWRDVSRESKFQGLHSIAIMEGLKLGMILFIISEILFFLSFFWTFFHVSLTPNIEAGSLWPPKTVNPFNYWEIPMLNTIILLTSGVTLTWSHLSLINKKKKESMNSLLMTIALGVIFASLQALEYTYSPYAFSDSSFGASFFIATGFHGLHIIIGTLFLMVTFARLFNSSFSPSHHIGFEMSAWYWHFVDVVWLFLFVVIYWWTLI